MSTITGATESEPISANPCQSSVENELLGERRSGAPADARANEQTRSPDARRAPHQKAPSGADRPERRRPANLVVNTLRKMAYGPGGVSREPGCVGGELARRSSRRDGAESILGGTLCQDKYSSDGAGHLYRTEYRLHDKVSFTFTAGSAHFEGGVGTRAVGGRVGVSAAGAEVAFGGKPSRESRADERLRLGLSVGLSGGCAITRRDADGDGKKEVGVACDLGPVSVAVESEDWGKTLDPAGRAVDDAQQRIQQATARLRTAVGEK